MAVAPIDAGTAGWPRLCGTGLSHQQFRLLARFPMTCCRRWVCRVPQGVFVLAQSPTEHGKSQDNMGKRSKKCSGLFCAWRSSKSCSLCAYDPLKGAECRRVYLGTDQLCQQSAGFNTLMFSQTQVAAHCHTASACSALTITLLTTQLSTPMFLCHSSHLISQCLGQQINPDHRTAMRPCCAVIWWERWLLVQLLNESLEWPLLSHILSYGAATTSPGFMNLRVVQLLSSLLQNSTEIQ